ncbi:MAG TPA: hypothetical protein PKC30_10675 [Saprospiraceae bacterium]|nr:hypothetical protein [Saprospiraceae bacterium]
MNMRKFLFSLILCMGVSMMSFAQKELTSGMIKMELVDVKSDNPQIAMGMEMMKGAITEVYFNSNKTLTKMNMMGGMVEMTSLLDNENENMDMLFNAMGQKMHISSTKEERDRMEAENNDAMKGAKIEEDHSDTKVILGYQCYRVNVKNPEIPGMNMSLYVTNEIKANPKTMQGMQNVELKGFPLEMVIASAEPNMTMVMRAVDLKTEVKDKVFEIKTDGYQKMNLKDFQKMMGSMGGAMGF